MDGGCLSFSASTSRGGRDYTTAANSVYWILSMSQLLHAQLSSRSADDLQPRMHVGCLSRMKDVDGVISCTWFRITEGPQRIRSGLPVCPPARSSVYGTVCHPANIFPKTHTFWFLVFYK